MDIKNKIKAVIMDGDGSTLTHTNELPNSLRDLFIANPATKWIMATGRSLDLLNKTPIKPYLTKDVPHILDGGSRLMYLDGSNFIDYNISIRELELFFNTIDHQLVNFIYYSTNGIEAYLFSTQYQFHHLKKLVGDKVTFTSEIDQFKGWAFKKLPTKLLIHTSHPINLKGLYYHQNGKNIDITASGINKGSACLELINHLKLKTHEIAFVFNDKNDLPLINHPQLSEITTIKVGDWLPEVTATYNVDSPYDVAKILKQII